MVSGLRNRHARRDSVGLFGDSRMPKVRDSPASLRLGRVGDYDGRANCGGQRCIDGGRGDGDVRRRSLDCTIIRWGPDDLWDGRTFFVVRRPRAGSKVTPESIVARALMRAASTIVPRLFLAAI
jgi:hypothetical protein